MSLVDKGRERTATAQRFLREHIIDHPNMSLSEAMRWLNNQRHAGQRLTVTWPEAKKVMDEIKQPPAGQKQLPIVVIPSKVSEPLRTPFAEVARLSLAQHATNGAAPAQPPVELVPLLPPRPQGAKTRAARIARVESLVLEHPEWGHSQVSAALIAEFGESIDSSIVGAALKLAREAAGLHYSSRPRRPKESALPALVAPAVPVPPDELLKEAGRVLKLLASRMQWASVTVKVTHEGTLAYSSEPLPALAVKGELKL